MKKVLTMLLAVVLMISVTACGGKEKKTESEYSNKEMEYLIQQIQKENSTSKNTEESSKTESRVESKLESTIESEVEPESSEIEEETESESESIVEGDELRTDFVEAMDAYEAFYDEYCELLVDYSKNPMDFTLLTKYTEMLEKAEEMDKKFEEWDEDDLTDVELKYYLDVNNRVMKKILDAESEMLG